MNAWPEERTVGKKKKKICVYWLPVTHVVGDKFRMKPPPSLVSHHLGAPVAVVDVGADANHAAGAHVVC
jgi:hypothetical protein